MDNIIKPMDIENKSFEIISAELGSVDLREEELLVLKRVIHTSADFEYKNNLVFSDNAVNIGIDALKKGCVVITDTNMALAGINKHGLAKGGNEAHCFIADPDVAETAKAKGVTRARVAMEKASKLDKPIIFAIGNAPTALIMLDELIKDEKIKPVLVIGVPVGFVNVVESKELIMKSGVPYIVAKGRKGGSNIAAAIMNAMIYQAFPR